MKPGPSCLLSFFPILLAGCATAGVEPATDPESVTYYHDRGDYKGGDNGYAVPIATCAEGTLFATFAPRWRIEKAPLSELMLIDTGEGFAPLWSVDPPRLSPQRDWPGGHTPRLACYPVQLDPVPLFVDERDLGTIDGARLEAHERPRYSQPGNEGIHFPVLRWERFPLQTGQGRSPLRVDMAEGQGNHGDSGVPRFVVLPDGTLAFLSMEIFRGGGGASHRVYLDLLEAARQRDPSVQWQTVRWPENEG